MKKTKNPGYRQLGLDKVPAKSKPKDEPRVRAIKAKSDLRVKGG